MSANYFEERNTNMKNINLLIIVIFVALTTLIVPQKAEATTAVSSAVLTTPIDFQFKVDDKRAQILRAYLESKNSPLAPYAQTFVYEADKNNLDWKLVAAISGLESSFGTKIPVASYNGWGFGVYGDNVRRFESWDDGIATVSKSLREDYMNKWHAQNVYEIGRIYAASPTWAVRVEYFINDIDRFANQQPTTLALSL